MIRNRDKIDRAMNAIDSKLRMLERTVTQNYGINDYKQLIKEIEKHVSNITNNLQVSKNNDILRRELKKLSLNITFLREAVDSSHPIEKYIKTIEVARETLAALEQGVDREPLDGFELSSPGRVN